MRKSFPPTRNPKKVQKKLQRLQSLIPESAGTLGLVTAGDGAWYMYLEADGLKVAFREAGGKFRVPKGRHEIARPSANLIRKLNGRCPGKLGQCKHICDICILEFLNLNPDKGHTWCSGTELDVARAMGPTIPDKVVLAKMRMLLRRDLVDGCGCGCRGDFVITSKGQKLLEVSRNKHVQ